MQIHEKLRAARKSTGMTLKEVAASLGVTHQAIQQIEAGKTTPRLETVIEMSKLYKRSLDDLMMSHINTAGVIVTTARTVPVISWVRAGEWCSVIDPYPVGVGSETINTTANVGPRTFALRVRGDSMTNPGGSPSFPDGTVIICDPDSQAENGSFVVVRLESSEEATFKQLVIDGGKRFLKPLNPRYPLIEISEETTLCGVVKEARMIF